jgi:hypothetical protein
MQPLPPRPIVTRAWMDKVKDLDGDGWHAYVYWSQVLSLSLPPPLPLDGDGWHAYVYWRQVLSFSLSHSTYADVC